MPWPMPWLNQMRICGIALGVCDQAEFEETLFEDLDGGALYGIGRAAHGVPGFGHGETGLLRFPHQAVDIGLLLAELAADRDGAGDVHAVLVELGGIVHQQKVAGLHRVLVGFVVQRGGVDAGADDAGVAPVPVAAQEGEFELRLNFVLGRAGHGQRVGALEAFGGDIDGVLQDVDFALRFHAAQVVEERGRVLDADAGADGGEFAGELLLAAVLDGVGARRQNHVDLEFLFAAYSIGLANSVVQSGVFGGRRGAAASSTSAAASARAFGGCGEDGRGRAGSGR